MSLTRDITHPLRYSLRALYHKRSCVTDHNETNGRRRKVRLPAGMYGMLPPEGIRLSDGGRPGPDGGICGDDDGGVRAEIRLPHVAPDAAAGAARREVGRAAGRE